MPPTIIESFTDAIRSFFSAWQLFIMQITPFYLAFFTGAYLILRKGGFPPATLRIGDYYHVLNENNILFLSRGYKKHEVFLLSLIVGAGLCYMGLGSDN